MLKRQTIIKLIKINRGEVYPMSDLEKQLFNSLMVYKQRNEFDGSIESAIDCLKLSGYEIE